MDTVETFYVLANSTGKQSDMVILYDNSVSFSKDYQGYVFGNGFLWYISGVVWDTSTIKKLGLVYKKAQGEFV